MQIKYKKSLFIFRRDLRLDDNTGLRAALEQSEKIIPCFIFDERQVGPKNEYRSENAIQFMIESLVDLDVQLHQKQGRLYLFYGNPEKIVTQLINQEKIDAVYLNKDYTPFSIKRDQAMSATCHSHTVAFHSFDDALLNQPETIMTGNGTPYSVFTAFYKRSSATHVALPQKLRTTNFYTKPISCAEPKSIFKKILAHHNDKIAVHGGRTEALKIVSKIVRFEDYLATRDLPAVPTTHLAAHLKFGTISAREAHAAISKKLGAQHALLRQLYWRDFFTYVAYHSPFVFGHAYHEKYDNLKWSYSKKDFERWRTGQTGFPIIDAGMRELNATGFMHNRVRMIVASFLTKDLHIDWKWGEKYFATQLVDYDPAVNNGNWQWSASIGCDAQPYFRIFNPWTQQEKFDSECVYIKKWVPELKKVDEKTIHNLYKNKVKVSGYPEPMVDHATESKVAKIMFSRIS